MNFVNRSLFLFSLLRPSLAQMHASYGPASRSCSGLKARLFEREGTQTSVARERRHP